MDFFKDIKEDDIESTDSVFISKTADDNGFIVVGVSLAFGNSEYQLIQKEEAIRVIELLKKACGIKETNSV